MKKKILLLLMLPLLLVPIFNVSAKEKQVEYESMNLKETLQSENIELKYQDYKETDKQVPIYLFRGTGCTYCRAFLEYLNEITEEYGKYFKLVSYEVWTNANNSDLLEKTSEFIGQQATGVPFIIIGDQIFPGYSESYNSAITTAIKKLYDSKNRYDVFEDMEKQDAIERRKAFFSSAPFIIICNTLITVITTVVVFLLMNKRIENLTSKLEKLEVKAKESNNKETKEHKEQKEEKKKSKSKEKNKK